jgi:hypothetical protein
MKLVGICFLALALSQAGAAFQPAEPQEIGIVPEENGRHCQDEAGKIYFLSLAYTGETYMTLDEITVMEGMESEYKSFRSWGSWYYQLIDEQQRVLESGTFSYDRIVCRDFIGAEGKWMGDCQVQDDVPLILQIPYHRDGADITIYDGTGTVRFGPYDIRDMQTKGEHHRAAA